MAEVQEKQSMVEARSFLVTIVFLLVLMLTAGAASYFIPAGKYVEVPATTSAQAPPQKTAPKGTTPAKAAVKSPSPRPQSALKKDKLKSKTKRVYKRIKQTPLPVWKIALAPILCLGGKSGPKFIVLILFILLIGASFSIMNRSGALPSLLAQLADRFSERKSLFLVVSVTMFALMGSTLGVLEEVVPMILFFVPVAHRMGWDTMTGMAIPFLSAGFGFAAATLNPFTVGTAQGLAGLEPFSGLGLRVAFFACTVSMVVGFLLWYTRRIEKDPTKSLTWEEDKDRREAIANAPAPEKVKNPKLIVGFLVFCLASIAGVILLGTKVKAVQALAFPLIALVFVTMGVGVGFLAGIGGKQVGKFFGKGMAEFAPAIPLILLAASVAFLVEEGNILGTLLHHMSGAISGWGKGAAAISLYGFQMLTNLFVPSGTGQAVLTIPIMAPLGDLVGITRQTVVLAFQCGDGFSNLLWPTNPLLIISLGIAGISYRKWAMWILPLQLALFVVSVGFLLLAVNIGY